MINCYSCWIRSSMLPCWLLATKGSALEPAPSVRLLDGVSRAVVLAGLVPPIVNAGFVPGLEFDQRKLGV